jgi:hypothetical protein
LNNSPKPKVKPKGISERLLSKYRDMVKELTDKNLIPDSEEEFKEILLKKYGNKVLDHYEIDLNILRGNGVKGVCLWKVASYKYVKENPLEDLNLGYKTGFINNVGVTPENANIIKTKRLRESGKDFKDSDIEEEIVEEENSDKVASDIEWIFHNIDNMSINESNCRSKGLYAYLLKLREDDELLKDFYRNIWGKVVRDKVDKENKMASDSGNNLSNTIKTMINILSNKVYIEDNDDTEDLKQEYYNTAEEAENAINKGE